MEMEEVDKEEDNTSVEGEKEVGLTCHTWQSKASFRKKTMHAAMPQSKLVSNLIVDDVKDMFSSDATPTFQKCRKLRRRSCIASVQ